MVKKASEGTNREKSKKQTVKSDMKPAKTPLDSFVVRGQVFLGDKVYAGAFLRAVDKDVSSEDLLGEAVTDKSGRYEIRYNEEQFRRSKNEKGGADLIIRVMDAKGVIIASSGKINNASREEIIDVVIKKKASPSADEWLWLKNYREWEADRKIFLFPENWLEPELRDDKKPFALITKLGKQNKTKERTYALVSKFSVGKRPGKGNSGQSPGTIRQALKLAAKDKADMVDLRVRQGKFKGDIVIDRPTRIIGTAAKGEGGVIIDGSVINDGGHYLVMKNVQIPARKNFGISQKGGILDMENIAIESVSRAINREAVIHISHGAQAVINALRCVGKKEGDDSRALYVKGTGTKVVVSGLIISNFKFAPALIYAKPFPAIGVIEVGDSGTLLVEGCMLTDNDYCGIYVHSGGKMHFRYGVVLWTKPVEIFQGTSVGYNFVFTSGAKVELRYFASGYAEGGIGLQDAYLTAENGIIKGNVNGMNIVQPPADYAPFNCIDTESVLFIGNASSFGIGAVPLPSIPSTPSTPAPVPDRSSCPVVAWA